MFFLPCAPAGVISLSLALFEQKIREASAAVWGEAAEESPAGAQGRRKKKKEKLFCFLVRPCAPASLRELFLVLLRVPAFRRAILLVSVENWRISISCSEPAVSTFAIRFDFA